MSYNQHNPRYSGNRPQGSRMRGGNSDENYDAPPYELSNYENSTSREDEGYRRDQSFRRNQNSGQNFGQEFGRNQDFRHNHDYRSSQQEFMDSDYDLGGRSREDWEQPRYSQQDDWQGRQWDRQQGGRQQQSRTGYGSQFFDRQSNSERPQRWGGERSSSPSQFSQRNQYGQEGYYAPQGGGWQNNASQRYQADYSAADFGDSGNYSGAWNGGYTGGYTQQDAGFQGWLDRGFQGQHQGARGTQQNTFRGRAPKGYERSDERIKEDLCERLTHDHLVDASEITVSVKAGVVTLDGSISDRNQKYRAEDLADNLSGVKDVQNRLNVVRAQQQSTQQST